MSPARGGADRREKQAVVDVATGDDVLNRAGTIAWDGQWSGVASSKDSTGKGESGRCSN